MLNDIKDWVIEKSDESREFANDIASEVQTTSVMDWSGSVWLVIAAVVIFMLIGALRS